MTSAGFVLRNLMRKPLQLTLTVLPMALAFIGFSLLIGLQNAYDFGRELDDERRIVTINRQSIVQPLPQSLARRMLDVPGIERSAYVTWFGGYHGEPDERFSQLAIDHATYFDVYREVAVTDEARRRWLDIPHGVLVTRTLASRFGWDVGDRVVLTSTIWRRADKTSDWTFEIAGIFSTGSDGAEPEMMLMKHEFLDRGRLFGAGTVSYVVAAVSPDSGVDEAILAVDAAFLNSRTPTYTSRESGFIESFQRQMGDLNLMTRLVLGMVVVIVFLMTTSSLAQSIVERRREMTVMNAIGFSNRRLGMFLLFESLVTVVGAALVASVATLGLARLFGQVFVDGPLSRIEIAPLDILVIATIALVLAVVGSLIPLARLLGTDLASNLKTGV
jgi:putative ABC transport system permease protein